MMRIGKSHIHFGQFPNTACAPQFGISSLDRALLAMAVSTVACKLGHVYTRILCAITLNVIQKARTTALTIRKTNSVQFIYTGTVHINKTQIILEIHLSLPEILFSSVSQCHDLSWRKTKKYI